MFGRTKRAPGRTTKTTTRRRGGLFSTTKRTPARAEPIIGHRNNHHHHNEVVTTATPHRHGYFTRGSVEPMHHQKRHATIGDKISGAMTKIKGAVEGRPGVKAAGTRRMHGTDGRGSRRTNY